MARPKRNSRGFFETTVTIGHDANGVRQRKRLRSKTLSGLRAKQEALLAEKSKGTAQVGLKPTLDVVLDHWITNVIAPTTSRSTYAVYEGHVRLYLKPMMGKNRMGKFGLTQVQKMVQQLTEHDPPLKATTIRGIVGTLCRAMNHAIEEKIITTNPTLGVKLPDAEAPDLETVTLSDVQALLVTMRGQRLEALIWFILTTGVRVGEALAVMWDDINFDEGIITIRHAVSRVKYPDGKTRLEFHQTKGRKVRYLPLLSILRPYLRHIVCTKMLSAQLKDGRSTGWCSVPRAAHPWIIPISCHRCFALPSSAPNFHHGFVFTISVMPLPHFLSRRVSMPRLSAKCWGMPVLSSRWTSMSRCSRRLQPPRSSNWDNSFRVMPRHLRFRHANRLPPLSRLDMMWYTTCKQISGAACNDRR